jgi:hypothetical protein
MEGKGFGDRLARGAKSANFPSMSHVSQAKWNDIFGERPLNVAKPAKKTNGRKSTNRKSS